MKRFFFGPAKLTKNADPVKYLYSVHGIGFDSRSVFSFSNGEALYNSFSVDVYNRKKGFLILGKGPADGLDDTTIAAEAEYSINFTEQQQKFHSKRLQNKI